MPLTFSHSHTCTMHRQKSTTSACAFSSPQRLLQAPRIWPQCRFLRPKTRASHRPLDLCLCARFCTTQVCTFLHALAIKTLHMCANTFGLMLDVGEGSFLCCAQINVRAGNEHTCFVQGVQFESQCVQICESRRQCVVQSAEHWHWNGVRSQSCE